MRLAIALAAALGCGGNAEPIEAPQPTPTGTATLIVEITGLRSDTGLALAGLYTSADGFPRDRSRALGQSASISGGRAEVTFESVPATRVAVAVIHDEDGDGEMKTGAFGIPKEGYGFSRDARARFGPPDFSDAAVSLRAGQSQRISIEVRY